MSSVTGLPRSIGLTATSRSIFLPPDASCSKWRKYKRSRATPTSAIRMPKKTGRSFMGLLDSGCVRMSEERRERADEDGRAEAEPGHHFGRYFAPRLPRAERIDGERRRVLQHLEQAPVVREA